MKRYFVWLIVFYYPSSFIGPFDTQTDCQTYINKVLSPELNGEKAQWMATCIDEHELKFLVNDRKIPATMKSKKSG